MTDPINTTTEYAFEFANAQVTFGASDNTNSYTQAFDAEGEAATPALDVDLQIAHGEFVCVCGDNGSGKSTLAKLACALYVPTAGKVSVFGYDTRDDASIAAIRRSVAYVFQNADDSIVAPDVLSEIAFTCENMGLPREEILTRIDDAMSTLGIEALRPRLVSELSGGQKQLVSIAGALASKPDALILDEPTSMLDADSSRRVITALKNAHSHGVTILAITHDPALAAVATKIIYLQHGHIVETPQNFRPHTTNQATRFHTKHIAPLATADEPSPSPFIFHTFGNKRGAAVIRLNNVSFAYSDDNSIFRNVNLELCECQIIVVQGQCGCGKSTLLKTIAGILRPTEGKVEWPGAAPLTNTQAHKSKTGVLGYSMQFPEKQLFAKDSLTDIEFGPKNLGLSKAEASAEAIKAMRAVGLNPATFANKSPFSISGGEQRKTAIAGVIAMSPKALLLDEPTSALDALARQDLAQTMRQLADAGCAILIATHDSDFINMLA